MPGARTPPAPRPGVRGARAHAAPAGTAGLQAGVGATKGVSRAPARGGLAGLRGRPWWPWLARGAAGVFFVLVACLLLYQARQVHWPEVWQALRALPAPALWMGAGFALLSHLAYGGYEWIGRRLTGHGLPRATTLGIALTSYPFTLNLGSVIGGVGVRWRLYSRRGIDPGVIGQVVATSVLTNWLGYALLMAWLPWQWTPPPLWGWSAPPAAWRTGGALLALVPLAYVGWCAARGPHALRFRGHRFALPGGRLAAVQVALPCATWLLMGAALWAVLQHTVPYPAALATVMLSAVAGLLLRVPAGLGVLESVGVALLAGSQTKAQVLAALLAYRALYYFAPLGLAGLALLLSEWRTAPKISSKKGI